MYTAKIEKIKDKYDYDLYKVTIFNNDDSINDIDFSYALSMIIDVLMRYDIDISIARPFYDD
jgi:hypothetical protein